MTDTHKPLPLTDEREMLEEVIQTIYACELSYERQKELEIFVMALSARALAAEARVKEAEGIIERSANALDWLDHLKQPTEEHLKKYRQEGRKAISAYFAKHRSA